MNRPHRYRQPGIAGMPGAQARDYSPKGLDLAGPVQGYLVLDGSTLGPLFDASTSTATTTTTPQEGRP
jgi:hypothetical protein